MSLRRPWSPGLLLLTGGVVGAISLFAFDLPEAVGGPVAWSLYWLGVALVLGVIAALSAVERTARDLVSPVVLLAVGWGLGWFVAFLFAFMVIGGEAT